MKPVSGADHIFGKGPKRLSIVEYGDYLCPRSAMAHHVMRRLLAKFPGAIQYVFRHYPLALLHPRAESAASAAEAAAAQGHFWEMHNILFRCSGRFNKEFIMNRVREMNMDPGRFEEDYHSPALRIQIFEKCMEAEASGVSKTPAFFINGTRHEEDWDPDSFLNAFQNALNSTSEEHQRPSAA